MTTEQPAQAIAFELDGTFDLDAARRLCGSMRTAPGDAELYVDFTHVREYRDNAFALLSQALAELGARAAVRGLGKHQGRLLLYLGAPSHALDQLH